MEINPFFIAGQTIKNLVYDNPSYNKLELRQMNIFYTMSKVILKNKLEFGLTDLTLKFKSHEQKQLYGTLLLFSLLKGCNNEKTDCIECCSCIISSKC
jgi:hypothetical protein